MLHRLRHGVLALVLLAAVVAAPAPAAGYSVLAHESMIDAAWDATIVPILRQRFPGTTADGLLKARAFAYGGSVIQDLGYYPFGSHLFTNLVHYVRSGDFVEALIRDAADVNEFAFALGALAHYTADNAGHPLGVNRAVPLIYPKLRAKFGDEVTYVEDPKRHIMVEFAFDVVQLAGGAYLPETYRSYVGFEVAKPLLERAFRETYALELKDLFLNEDLAIGTYRYAISKTIPEMTRVAWRSKQDDIRKVTPTVQRSAFLYTLTRRQYEQAFGTNYRKPGVLARFIVLVMRVVPKIGPFRALAFKAPTPEAERLFADSFMTARERFRALLADSRDGRVTLTNTDFDTGRIETWGQYPLADETYAELLDKLQGDSVQIPPPLRASLVSYFKTFGAAGAPASTADGKPDLKRDARIRQQLAVLSAAR
jgi:hypothetical protein